MTEIIIEPLSPEEQEFSEGLHFKNAEYLRKGVEDTRRGQYQLVADPLFFGWQRGENTEQEWLDAIQAVKDANPYPSVES